MATKYPAQIDNTLTLPNVVDSLTPVQAKQVNLLRDAIISIQSELGVKPAGIYSTVKNRITTLETTINSLNSITISGDLGGTSSNILVDGIQGRPVAVTAPTNGQALVWNGTNWAPGNVATTTPDATSGIKGILQLTGDLAGTASSPVVAKLNGITVTGTPANGNVLTATGTTAATWSAPSGGGGTDATTGAKGIVQLAGDLGGTAALPLVLKVNGIAYGNSGVPGQAMRLINGSSAGYGAIDLTNGSAVSGILPAANHPDATTGAKGIIQLATDLGGTSTAPTVLAASGTGGIFSIKCTKIRNTSTAGIDPIDDLILATTTTNSATFTTAYTFATTTSGLSKINVQINCIQSTGAKRATFDMSLSVYNNAGVLSLIGARDKVSKTDDALLDIEYLFSGTNVLIQVKGLAAGTFTFKGTISTLTTV